jgi:hypothetical protein
MRSKLMVVCIVDASGPVLAILVPEAPRLEICSRLYSPSEVLLVQ